MKKRGVIYLRKAQEDIDQITNYIAQDNFEKAVVFFESTETICAMLSTMPDIGGIRNFHESHFPTFACSLSRSLRIT